MEGDKHAKETFTAAVTQQFGKRSTTITSAIARRHEQDCNKWHRERGFEKIDLKKQAKHKAFYHWNRPGLLCMHWKNDDFYKAEFTKKTVASNKISTDDNENVYHPYNDVVVPNK